MLDILDTAGQEEYSAMRDDYMSQGNGFLMVYSITDFQSFEDCLKIYDALIKMKTPDDTNEEIPPIPIILAGNKCDLEEERSVTTEEGKELAAKFGDVCKFYETSAKERINVDEVFEELVRLINKVQNKSGIPETNFDQVEDAEANEEGEEASNSADAPAQKSESKPAATQKPQQQPAKQQKKKSGGCTLL